MARLTIRGLQKYYGKVHALRGIDLDIAEGEFCVFVGPSGCGKSTLLRTIAGLEDTDGGTHRDRRRAGRRRAPARPQHRHGVPELRALPLPERVREHRLRPARAPLRRSRDQDAGSTAPPPCWASARCSQRLPRELSGGQRQRVAIGRAIVRDARLFLFDEPLSNLDAQLRDGMRAEIKRLHQEIGKTTVYVTHDQVEAMTLADRIVLLKDGVIEQQGPPLELFERPATRFVAGFLGSPQMNFVPCRLELRDGNPDRRVRRRPQPAAGPTLRRTGAAAR